MSEALKKFLEKQRKMIEAIPKDCSDFTEQNNTSRIQIKNEQRKKIFKRVEKMLLHKRAYLLLPELVSLIEFGRMSDQPLPCFIGKNFKFSKYLEIMENVLDLIRHLFDKTLFLSTHTFWRGHMEEFIEIQHSCRELLLHVLRSIIPEKRLRIYEIIIGIKKNTANNTRESYRIIIDYLIRATFILSDKCVDELFDFLNSVESKYRKLDPLDPNSVTEVRTQILDSFNKNSNLKKVLTACYRGLLDASKKNKHFKKMMKTKYCSNSSASLRKVDDREPKIKDIAPLIRKIKRVELVLAYPNPSN
jgi:hypothetical protein